MAGTTDFCLVVPVTACLLHNQCTIGWGGTPTALVEIEMKVLVKTATIFLHPTFCYANLLSSGNDC